MTHVASFNLEVGGFFHFVYESEASAVLPGPFGPLYALLPHFVSVSELGESMLCREELCYWTDVFS